MIFGVACRPYVEPRCDAVRECYATHFSTPEALSECVAAAEDEEAECEEPCQEALDAAVAENDDEEVLCEAPCDALCDGCAAAVASCTEDCDAAFDPCLAGGGTFLECLEASGICYAACGAEEEECQDGCTVLTAQCRFDCQTLQQEADATDEATYLGCKDQCCSTDAAHPQTCRNECEKTFKAAEDDNVGDYRPCRRLCFIPASEGGIDDECLAECAASEAHALDALAADFYSCTNQCGVEDWRAQQQCGWYQLWCEETCEETFLNTFAACDPGEDGAGCRTAAALARFNCRFICCTDQKGNDAAQSAYADCWRSSGCAASESACEDDFLECLETAAPPGTCSDCGPRAKAAFSLF